MYFLGPYKGQSIFYKVREAGGIPHQILGMSLVCTSYVNGMV